MRKRAVGGALAGGLAGLLGSVACGPTGHHTNGGQRPWPEPGHVLHIVFATYSSGTPEEVRTEHWKLIGEDRTIVHTRARSYDAAGRLETDSFGVTAERKAYHVYHDVNHGPQPRRFENQLGPRAPEPVMWTNASLQQLLSHGFRASGRVVVAGIAGTVYERRKPISQAAPTAQEQAVVPVPPSALRAFVHRVYVGHEPFGLDLGEEAGYEDLHGQLHPVFYRKLVLHEMLPASEVPPDAFDWPYGAD
ncbi:MAG TPA: hypothetical protein VGW38_19085 [Chloroflexota bacterium]|nr:hypothetical protein [Chloroflexota bacterium]